MAIDSKKGLKIVQKIEYLLDNLDAKENPVEKDLLLGYIRSLYDVVLFEEKPAATKSTKSSKKAKKNKEVVLRVEVNQPTPPRQAAIVVPPPPPPPPKPAPVAPPPPPPRPVVATPPPPPPRKKTVLVEHEDLFEFKVASDLSEKLQDRPVKDLNKAFAINDRLLTTSKLFRGDTEAFKETLIKLNSLNSFEDAKVYLSHHLVDSFGWMDKSKFKTAKIFMKTIRRRYM